MSGLRSRRPPGPAAAARATWPRCRPTSRSPRRWRVSPCAGAQSSPCRRRRSSLTAWSVPRAPEPSLSAPSGVALVLFAEGCQSCAPTVAAGRVARSLLVPPTPGCPALRSCIAPFSAPELHRAAQRSPTRSLPIGQAWLGAPALPFLPSPFRSRAPLECRFRSSPPTHHGGDRTRRHDGESRPCRRTPLGLLSQGATRARGGGVNCKQSASRRGFAGGAGAAKGAPTPRLRAARSKQSSAGAPAIPVTADRSGSAYGCRRASRRSRLVWPGAPPPITRRWRIMTRGTPNLPFQPSPRGRHPRSCS